MDGDQDLNRKLTKLKTKLEGVNYRVDYDADASEIYRDETHAKLDKITKSIEALTGQLRGYHETSNSLHTTLSSAIVKIQNVLVANGEKLAGLKPTIRGTWIRGQAGYSDKMERFEKNDVKDPVNLKL
jgi:hypothetical protein